jgi:eukaryotic-like serine/threonine-protein kinase
MDALTAPVQEGVPSLPQSRYELIARLASGGMATVYLGRHRGAAGFSRAVAVKRAHPHVLEDPTFHRLLVQEARLASKIHHPNAVGVLDVEDLGRELLLVMDYVHGVSLARIGSERATRIPAPIAVRIGLDVAFGLHAAHTATDDDGTPLRLVHRDVTPQNVLVGLDGVARLTDFGIARSIESGDQLTSPGAIRGKLGYFAPEYLLASQVDRRGDVFALGVVLWEALTGQRLFRGAGELATFKLILGRRAPRVSSLVPNIGPLLDGVLAHALEKDPARRYDSAEELAVELERAARAADLLATPSDVGAFVRARYGVELEGRRALFRAAAGETSEPPRSSRPQKPARGPRWRPLTGTLVAGAAVLYLASWLGGSAPADGAAPTVAAAAAAAPVVVASSAAAAVVPPAGPEVATPTVTTAAPTVAALEAPPPKRWSPPTVSPPPPAPPPAPLASSAPLTADPNPYAR